MCLSLSVWVFLSWSVKTEIDHKHTPPLGPRVCACVSIQSLRFLCSGQRVTTVLNRVDLIPGSIQPTDPSANKHTETEPERLIQHRLRPSLTS